MWSSRKYHHLTRDQLYELVWADPVYKVAARYAISGTALAKRCRNAKIPLPECGYWSRVQAGQQPERRRLPPATAGHPETISIVQGKETRLPRLPASTLDSEIYALVEAEFTQQKRIVVLEIESCLYPEAKRMVDATQKKRDWSRRNDSLELLEVRRQRILHAFFHAVEERGGAITAASDSGFNVTLLGSTFRTSCAEIVSQTRVPMTKMELKQRPAWEFRDHRVIEERTSVLRMRTNRGERSVKDFVDSLNSPLESQLNDVMV